MLLVSCGRCEDCFAESAIFIFFISIVTKATDQRIRRPGGKEKLEHSPELVDKNKKAGWTNQQPQIYSLARKVQTRVQPARCVVDRPGVEKLLRLSRH